MIKLIKWLGFAKKLVISLVQISVTGASSKLVEKEAIEQRCHLQKPNRPKQAQITINKQEDVIMIGGPKLSWWGSLKKTWKKNVGADVSQLSNWSSYGMSLAWRTQEWCSWEITEIGESTQSKCSEDLEIIMVVLSSEVVSNPSCVWRDGLRNKAFIPVSSIGVFIILTNLIPWT